MKYLIASDIHGSAYYCEKLLNCFKEEKADRLLLLGDLLYHGPRNDLPKEYEPKTVISMLNEKKEEILCVRGNCDTEVDQMVLDFPVLADYAVLFVDGRSFFLSHGHHHNPDSLPPLNDGDVLINGHTHVLKAFLKDGIHCLNVGSVSLPKENNPRSYMIYENNSFIIKTLDGDELLKYDI